MDAALPAGMMEAFWARVLPEPNTGCWLWDGGVTLGGYGIFYWKGKRRYAHRFSYALAQGAIPTNCEIDHLCRTPACCNPDHLEAVTHRINSLRGISPSAQNSRKHLCQRGHAFTADNLVQFKSAVWGRRCKKCHAAREKERQRASRV